MSMLKEFWNDIFLSNEWGKYPNEEIIRFIARNFYSVDNREDIKILEVGSGTGANLWYICREGFACYGIEGSKSGTERSISRLDNETPGWKGMVIEGDLTVLPYEDCFFDAVIDNEAIYCNSFEQSQKAYSEIYRVLKKNGLLYTRSFSTETTGYQTGKECDYNRFIVTHGPLLDRGPARFSTEEDLRELLHDFNILEFNRIVKGYAELDSIAEWSVTAKKQ